MPRGRQGQKRPADPSAYAVHVGRIAKGKTEDTRHTTQRSKSGCAGAKASAEKLMVSGHAEVANKAAEAPWWQ